MKGLQKIIFGVCKVWFTLICYHFILGIRHVCFFQLFKVRCLYFLFLPSSPFCDRFYFTLISTAVLTGFPQKHWEVLEIFCLVSMSGVFQSFVHSQNLPITLDYNILLNETIHIYDKLSIHLNILNFITFLFSKVIEKVSKYISTYL